MIFLWILMVTKHTYIIHQIIETYVFAIIAME